MDMNKYSNREKMYILFKKMHILPLLQYINRRILKRQKLDDFYSIRRSDFNKKLEDYSFLRTSNNILISGYVSTFQKGGNKFFKEIQKRIPYARMIVLSQSGYEITEKLHQNIEFEFLALPSVPFKGGYDIGLKQRITYEMRRTIKEKSFLQDAIYNIKSYHNDMGDGYAEAMVYWCYKETIELIEKLSLKMLIVHNVLYPMHNVMSEACKERDVEVVFFEFGALPGTFVLEQKGQMGASSVATGFEEFNKLKVVDDDFVMSQRVLDYMRDSRLNRNVQPQLSQIELIKKRLKPNRPVILYAGQNDFDSGICPYNDNSKKNHSPIFKNSDEAAVYLSELAEKNDWIIIYKPHPLCVKHGKCLEGNVPRNVIWVTDTDINELIDIADVVVTILSQVGEIALIRNKATVMLGYTHIKNKSCCYEAYKKDVIEKQLLNALKNGYSDDQKENYQKYVARMLKYYLFDDMTNRPVRYGQDIEAAATYIKSKVRGLEEQDVNLKTLNEKFIFVESDMFDNRIASNELDFLDYLADEVGRENIIVKLFSEDCAERFKVREYKTIYITPEEWLYRINSCDDKVIVGAYPLYECEQLSGNKTIWVNNMIVSKTERREYRSGIKNDYSPNSVDKYVQLLHVGVDES